jgi:hypothetical protein
MRDDLHRTEALRNHWRRAVRLAGRPAERGAAALELARATFQEFREGIRNEWSSELNAKIRLSGTLGIIDALERKAVRPLEFRLCEILRCSAYDQRPDEIVRAAQVAVRQECAESAIEHCALSVAREHDEGQARELRQAMSAMLARADLSEEPHLKRKSAGDPGELVDTPLELTL